MCVALIKSYYAACCLQPTSGLDSFTSNEVMTVVKGLVKDGVTIVATIHSPTAYAFSLFDSLMMLVRGRMVYFGPTGAPAVAFVQKDCAKLHSNDHAVLNEAEWLVDLFTEADRKGRGGEYADVYATSALAQTTAAKVHQLESQKDDLPPHVLAELAVKSETVTPWWWGLRTMIKVGGCGGGGVLGGGVCTNPATV
jgi:ABC-type multidrug transport system ATPase subunit